jgi:hypothetical protein
MTVKGEYAETSEPQVFKSRKEIKDMAKELGLGVVFSSIDGGKYLFVDFFVSNRYEGILSQTTLHRQGFLYGKGGTLGPITADHPLVRAYTSSSPAQLREVLAQAVMSYYLGT